MTPENNNPDRFAESVAAAFSAAAKVTRAEVFGGVNDRWMPVNNQDDAMLPFIGYVRVKFRPGGAVLVAINPGGGGDAYRKTAEDRRFCPAVQSLRDGPPELASVAAAEVFRQFSQVMPTWNLWKIINPVLRAIYTDIHSFAFLNVVPFRTRGDKLPPVSALNVTWRRVISPRLSVLKPSQVIALGKKARDVLVRFGPQDWRLVKVPRTNGDSYVCPEAKAVLAELSNRQRQA